MTDEGGLRATRPGSIPKPAHRVDRAAALPGEQPNGAEEESRARDALRRILQSPSYQEANQDEKFLQSEATRGIRLQLDFLKAETLLREHQIAHTIVVFGSTRICEARAARRAVTSIADALSLNPDDEGLQRRLKTARSIAAKSKYYRIAREFGRIVGAAGEKAIGGRLMIMTGGGPGIMEAANRGAHDVGAQSVGLNITLPNEQYPNPYATPELCFRFHYFAVRKLHLLMRARALVAFPGGFGTMDELFEVLSLAQTRKIAPVPVVLVGESYWRRAFDPDFLVDEGIIDPEDRDLFWFAESAEEAWRDILRWYEAAGRPLLPVGDEASQGRSISQEAGS
ncbi:MULTISPECIES: TIGR00730 family Rossman fold protein [Bradyrhizobium]|uniref:AMP nucleosidase n=1 Tax=Bradyrhizobium elkanii TaxID=29448 RepID=A0A4U6S119_BRAEL|nr:MULTISPECIES: TIGR00730 family Rossman fold protein [Bradyrhizobium]MTV15451.1 TIGR00730 family Rossman fold protein [Bradyrhizobium sp. BR2003]TKV81179.1 TIGR00730 family Rossman fold protein [Bradyrhizobium elkanii]